MNNATISAKIEDILYRFKIGDIYSDQATKEIVDYITDVKKSAFEAGLNKNGKKI